MLKNIRDNCYTVQELRKRHSYISNIKVLNYIPKSQLKHSIRLSLIGK
uniref:Uncharacterized protein n=1 Tax=Rhizophora mucronata TaxID=61149 RepID=A0A2P2JJG5_RHIMU